MADVSELAKLSPEKLEKVQSIIALFHLLGMTDEDIGNLVDMAKKWPIVVKNMNAMAEDLVLLKQGAAVKSSEKAKEFDNEESLRLMVGFDSRVEEVKFGEGGDNNGRKK